MTPRTKAKLNENLGLLLDFLRKKHGSTDEETERMLFSALSWTAEDVEIQRQHPASDHEMLCEIWETSRKMMAALDEVCYRTATSSWEEQEAHDQKVRREGQDDVLNELSTELAQEMREDLIKRGQRLASGVEEKK